MSKGSDKKITPRMRGHADEFRKRLLRWYDASRRDLPWRVKPQAGGGEKETSLDPYHVLVSEAMLQQTQVATVIPYYRRFLERFPTVRALAEADEQAVLRLWQGLGYYSRARNLQAAAKRVMEDFGGRLPGTAEQLRTLPGVGRYTAGAVASIAFNQRAPILDGNVIRVLCRLDGIETDPREKETHELLWRRAEEVLPHPRGGGDARVGDFNSALMELGALVCTPRSPHCLICPVREHCRAFAAGMQEKIPPVKKRTTTPLERRWTVCVESGGRWLIERRPGKGRWAGMWQFVTVERGEGEPTAKAVQRWIGTKVSRPERIGEVKHALTHRRYEFEVYRCAVKGKRAAPGGRAWVTMEELGDYPLPRPHVKIAAMLDRS